MKIQLKYIDPPLNIHCGTAHIIVEPDPEATYDLELGKRMGVFGSEEVESSAPVHIVIPEGQYISAMHNPKTGEDYHFQSERGETDDLEGPIAFILFGKPQTDKGT